MLLELRFRFPDNTHYLNQTSKGLHIIMTPQKELKLAYGLAIILLIVGVLSYVAFSAKTPSQPVRIMFKSVGGKVLFDHKTHTSDSGYGLSCTDCHHNLEEGDVNPQGCGECHEAESEDPDVPKKSDAFHRQCIECHKNAGAGPEKCSSCHVM